MREIRVNLGRFASSLLVAAINAAFVCLAFLAFFFPRFTRLGLWVSAVIVVVAATNVALVVRDLCRSGTRARAVGAILLWVPLFLFVSIVSVWEGPLYAVATGNPPSFQVRGAASFCGLEIYGPDEAKAEWYGDNAGLIWAIAINAPAQYHPITANIDYGSVPHEFSQRWPIGSQPPPLDGSITYHVVLERCMGGPQNFALRDLALTEYQADSSVCWGNLKVAERPTPASVRVNCQTNQPLPMSDRAKQRLQAYRKNQIPFY